MARKRRQSDDEQSEAMLVDAWSVWIASVPEEDRSAVAAIIRSCDISTKAGLNVFLLQLLAALFEGRIHPVVLASAKPYVQMLMTNTYMLNAENGTPQLTGPSMAQAMLEIRQQIRERVRPLEPVYTFVDEEEDILEAEVG